MDQRVPPNKRKERIKELIESIGLGNISRNELAKEFNCNRKTVRSDINKVILEGIDKNVLARAKININSSNEAVMKKMRAIMVGKSTDRDKISAANILLNASKEHTDFLERYAFKEKTAEVIDTNITVKWEDGGDNMTEENAEEKKEETTTEETTEKAEEKPEESKDTAEKKEEEKPAAE